jgi:hypothetical protein
MIFSTKSSDCRGRLLITTSLVICHSNIGVGHPFKRSEQHKGLGPTYYTLEPLLDDCARWEAELACMMNTWISHSSSFHRSQQLI